jgi:tetratricopeptide (TPR) repeat protein
LLDQQFATNPDFADFINPRFITVRFEPKHRLGVELFKKYSILSPPTIIVAEADGTEIDRIVGYSPPAVQFLKEIERMYNRIDTYGQLKEAYKKDPNNSEIIFKLALRYKNTWRKHIEAKELFEKVVANPQEAKNILTYNKEVDEDVNIYEQALFYGGQMDHSLFKRLKEECPNTKMKNSPYFRYWKMGKTISLSPYLSIKQRLENSPNDINLQKRYLSLVVNYEEDIEDAIKIAEKSLSKNSEFDPEFLHLYSKLLALNDQFDKIYEIYGHNYMCQLKDVQTNALKDYAIFWIKERKNIESAIQATKRTELMGRQEVANVLVKQGDVERALDVFGEDFSKTFFNNDAKLNTYAYFWAGHGFNLKSALEASKQSLKIFEHQVYFNTLANVYWKMKNYKEAIFYENEALRLDPNYLRAKKEKVKIKEEMVAAND